MTNRGIPTVSANGAKIGIDNTANPDDDGTIKPKKKKITNKTMINKGPLICCTMEDEKCKIVSEINPLFNTKLIPRAKPIINDTPTRLDAPFTNASTVSFSPRPYLPIPAINIMIIVNIRNADAIIGNHQPCVITPQTMIGNGNTNKVSMIFT